MPVSETKRPLTPRSTRLQEFAQYRRIASIDEMGRRKFANNAFDGILTMIGVVMGSYVAGVREPRIIVSTGLATCMAMGISGFWGAYVTESAERKRELQDLEHAMLRDLGETEQARASRFAAIVVSVIDGLSPLVAGMFVLLPFLFAGAWFAAGTSYVAALAMAFLLLFGLGVFLGKVARENALVGGVRMIVAGLVCVALTFLISGGG
jgi:predicted membrane protein (TIGR00267 family)